MGHIQNDNIVESLDKPSKKVKASELFKIDTDLEINIYEKKDVYVPETDTNYIFDKDTTLAILAGFQFNRRVMIQGYHGTGKSTHIEQVAARLNWRCLRVNLDSHVSRIDLIGKDAIVLENGSQITKFKDGIIPWALTNGVALFFND